jgi:hypothetical protein
MYKLLTFRVKFCLNFPGTKFYLSKSAVILLSSLSSLEDCALISTNTNSHGGRDGSSIFWYRGGGGGICQLLNAELCWSCTPPAHQLTSQILLDYCIWIVIVVHSSLIIMLSLKLLYFILSLIFFCFIMKNSTPLARARRCTPPP